jgi:UDP-N-acetylglucosamine--N-acetylmuramyl-(pentapeptide) pyrophosphoryl-undecaprenol N-acetylglucosamine transferase
MRRERTTSTDIIVFTGGGTGGHVYPGLAVFEALGREFQERVIWVGSTGGLERDIVTSAGIPYTAIPVGKLRRYFSFQNIADLFRVVAGIFVAFRFLRAHNVTLVFSKGGFVAVPTVIAAGLQRIPVVIHESDDDPGLATRLCAPFARVICVARPEVVAAIPVRYRGRVVITGNPIRAAFQTADPRGALPALGMVDSGLPVILVTGGSQGAAQLNELLEAILPVLTQEAIVIHQTGDGPDRGKQNLTDIVPAGRYYGTSSFGKEFPMLMRRADIVISRAGAGTLGELSATGTAAILIPLSTAASRGDQVRNAAAYGSSGAAEVLDPDEVTAEQVLERVLYLLRNPEIRNQLAERARLYTPANAAERIATILRQAVES